MLAITQAQYYTALLKYILLALGGTLAAVTFFALVYAIVFYSHYWK